MQEKNKKISFVFQIEQNKKMNFVGYADFRLGNLLVCDRELKKRHDIPSRGDIKKRLAHFRKKRAHFSFFLSFLKRY